MIRFLLILLLLPASAWAQLKATGPSTWTDTVSGRNYNNMGPGGRPTLCYQKADSTWDFIVDKWVQVGPRQVWKSVRGNHRVFVDSTGAAIYARGNHYLGTKTTHLIKFNKADSTWQLLKASLPDSLTIRGRSVTFYDIFPGVDLRKVNNAKVFQQYTETFVFHQEARDSLAVWGPWAGHLLGTATRLNVDSLNLSWKDALGLFDIDVAGRTTDGWVRAMDSDTMVFTIASSVLHTRDSTTTIKVHKRLVIRNGNPYLVEMFNPILAAGLPEGDVWHNATFGDQGTHALYYTIADRIQCLNATPASDGDVDSITACIKIQDSDRDVRTGLYRHGASNYALIDSSTELSIPKVSGEYIWRSFPLQEDASVTAGDRYFISVWAATGYGYVNGLTSGTDTVDYDAETYSGAGWPATLDGLGADPSGQMAIYCTYSTGAPPETNRRRRVIELLRRKR